MQKNIITIEDPVEYTMPLVQQVQVNEKAGIGEGQQYAPRASALRVQAHLPYGNAGHQHVPLDPHGFGTAHTPQY